MYFFIGGSPIGRDKGPFPVIDYAEVSVQFSLVSVERVAFVRIEPYGACLIGIRQGRFYANSGRRVWRHNI